MRSLLLFLVSIGSLVFLNEYYVSAKTCQSLDIRNSVDEFDKLNECTIIVGSLSVVLFENVKTSDFDNKSFPDLIEITGYLLFYRVRGIKSLDKLFPNLTTIRGLELIRDYALVIYDMIHLQEIGLSSLSKIGRGSVRIEKNPSLCYIDTVNWKILVDEKFHPLLVTSGSNKPPTECPTCPEECKALKGSPRRNCWTSQYCQKVIDPKCHPECMGGCTGERDDQCKVCKNYKDGKRCVSNCSADKYLLASEVICITKDECHARGRWTVHNECVNTCSTGYEPVMNPINNITYCKYCGAECPIICDAAQIEDMTAAQTIKGCTHIKGSLVIKLNGPNDVEDELEQYLGNIKEISGVLKIHRSSLRSLNFLKSLRVIKGKTSLDQKRYSLIIQENDYLQSLWDWDNFTLELQNGTVNIHFNRELCMSEINSLTKLVKLKDSFKNITPIDISPYSNGQSFACNQINITTEIELLGPNTVNLKWNASSLPDQESLIAYLIYYIEAENKNITTFDEDACGDLGWRTIFVSNQNNTKILNQTIYYLEPFTKYAFYISTAYNTGKGGQSFLNYFKTLSSDPSNPGGAVALASGSESLLVTWRKPNKLNGILSHYEIYTYMLEDDISYIDLRNYCINPLEKIIPKVPKIVPNIEITTLSPKFINSTHKITQNKCVCKPEERFTVITNDFDTICSTLDVYGEERNQSRCADFSYQVDAENSIRKRDKAQKPLIYQIPANETHYKITGLRHFTIHILLLRACNLKESRNNETEYQCSSVVQISQRTAPKPNADNIDTPRIYLSSDVLYVKWEEPKDPNGVIVAYHIEYRRVDKENHKLLGDCITRRNHRESGSMYKLQGLTPGNYSFRIKAVSLAGDGNYTETVYYYIPMPGNSSTIIYIIVILILILILFTVIGVYIWYKKRHQLDSVHLITTCNPDYVGYQEDEWEMDRDNVKLMQELGQGTFGTVYQGLIKDRQIPCAIKTVNEKADLHDKMEFLNEASVMKSFNDAHHVVRLLGVVSRGIQPLVVMELMARGDLKTFLRSTRDGSTCLTCSEMYRMAAEIADGMAYLSAKKFVHRDLAARNCMVSSDRTVKIGDFGMTRDIYETDYYRKETRGLLPVRWMSPESLADGVFTTESDTWSYGIVLWEIATLAEQPYQGLANEQVLQFVIAKGTLERPQQCPDLLYEIMDACWKWRPYQRPTFADIVEKLETHVGQDFKLVSFYHSKEGEEFRLVKRELNKINTLPYQGNVGALANYQNRNVAALWTKDANDCSFYMSGSPANSVGPSSSYQSPNGFRSYPSSSSP